MSNAFYEKYGNKKVSKAELKKWCQRPGKTLEDGSPAYTTEQAHKKQCDVNEIIRKYDKTGLIAHTVKFEHKYGDATGADFKEAMDMVLGAQAMFDELPIHVKKRFDQSPEKYLKFFEDENNRDEAIKLGLINEAWTPDTDGLGEHVAQGEQQNNDNDNQ